MPARPAIPRGVWILGFVSLLMDVSSEMIHSLLPLYLTVGLGASALVVGIIEGVAEATTLIVKVFSGTLSDCARQAQVDRRRRATAWRRSPSRSSRSPPGRGWSSSRASSTASARAFAARRATR